MAAWWSLQQLVKFTANPVVSAGQARPGALVFGLYTRRVLDPDRPLQFGRIGRSGQALQQIGVTDHAAGTAVLQDPGEAFLLFARPDGHGHRAQLLQCQQGHDKARVVALVKNHTVAVLKAQLQESAGGTCRPFGEFAPGPALCLENHRQALTVARHGGFQHGVQTPRTLRETRQHTVAKMGLPAACRHRKTGPGVEQAGHNGFSRGAGGHATVRRGAALDPRSITTS
jgi:hypothetical protein